MFPLWSCGDASPESQSLLRQTINPQFGFSSGASLALIFPWSFEWVHTIGSHLFSSCTPPRSHPHSTLILQIVSMAGLSPARRCVPLVTRLIKWAGCGSLLNNMCYSTLFLVLGNKRFNLFELGLAIQAEVFVDFANKCIAKLLHNSLEFLWWNQARL